jgi:hypothetical protein
MRKLKLIYLVFLLIISEISRAGVEESLSHICVGYSQTVDRMTSMVQEASKSPATNSFSGTIIHDPNGTGINASYGIGQTVGVRSSMFAYSELLKILAVYLTYLKYWIGIFYAVRETLGLFVALTMTIAVFFGFKKGPKLQV